MPTLQSMVNGIATELELRFAARPVSSLIVSGTRDRREAWRLKFCDGAPEGSQETASLSAVLSEVWSWCSRELNVQPNRLLELELFVPERAIAAGVYSTTSKQTLTRSFRFTDYPRSLNSLEAADVPLRPLLAQLFPTSKLAEELSRVEESSGGRVSLVVLYTDESTLHSWSWQSASPALVPPFEPLNSALTSSLLTAVSERYAEFPLDLGAEFSITFGRHENRRSLEAVFRGVSRLVGRGSLQSLGLYVASSEKWRAFSGEDDIAFSARSAMRRLGTLNTRIVSYAEVEGEPVIEAWSCDSPPRKLDSLPATLVPPGPLLRKLHAVWRTRAGTKTAAWRTCLSVTLDHVNFSAQAKKTAQNPRSKTLEASAPQQELSGCLRELVDGEQELLSAIALCEAAAGVSARHLQIVFDLSDSGLANTRWRWATGDPQQPDVTPALAAWKTKALLSGVVGDIRDKLGIQSVPTASITVLLNRNGTAFLRTTVLENVWGSWSKFECVDGDDVVHAKLISRRPRPAPILVPVQLPNGASLTRQRRETREELMHRRISEWYYQRGMGDDVLRGILNDNERPAEGESVTATQLRALREGASRLGLSEDLDFWLKSQGV